MNLPVYELAPACRAVALREDKNSATAAASRPGVLFNPLNNGAANDCRIRKAADFGELLRRRDAKAHRNGQLGVGSQAFDQGSRIAGHFLPGSGDAGTRDGIDKAARVLGDGPQP